jgi:hypothetical protein
VFNVAGMLWTRPSLRFVVRDVGGMVLPACKVASLPGPISTCGAGEALVWCLGVAGETNELGSSRVMRRRLLAPICLGEEEPVQVRSSVR